MKEMGQFATHNTTTETIIQKIREEGNQEANLFGSDLPRWQGLSHTVYWMFQRRHGGGACVITITIVFASNHLGQGEEDKYNCLV